MGFGKSRFLLLLYSISHKSLAYLVKGLCTTCQMIFFRIPLHKNYFIINKQFKRSIKEQNIYEKFMSWFWLIVANLYFLLWGICMYFYFFNSLSFNSNSEDIVWETEAKCNISSRLDCAGNFCNNLTPVLSTVKTSMRLSYKFLRSDFFVAKYLQLMFLSGTI